MIDKSRYLALLEKHTQTANVTMDHELFGSGLDISSLRLTEFVMELEEENGIDIDVDDLENGIVTVGQLYQRLTGNEHAVS